MKGKCKWCKRKANYSFGILGYDGEWVDKHLTCKSHASISMANQELKSNLMTLSERAKMFWKSSPMIFGTNP